MNDLVANDDYILTIRKEDYELGELAPSSDELVVRSDAVSSRASIDSTTADQNFHDNHDDDDEEGISNDDHPILDVSSIHDNRSTTTSNKDDGAVSVRQKSRAQILAAASKGVLARARKRPFLAAQRRPLPEKLMKRISIQSSTNHGSISTRSNESLEMAPTKSIDKKFAALRQHQSGEQDSSDNLKVADMKLENIRITCLANKASDVKPKSSDTNKTVKPKLVSKVLSKNRDRDANPKNEGINKAKENPKILSKNRDRSPVTETVSPYDPFFKDTRYFMIKSCNEENVILSKVKGVWATTPRNERLLNKAYRRHRNVLLIFSVEKSQAFQGFCRMISESSNNGPPVNWVLPRNMNLRALGGVFRVQWLNRGDLNFSSVERLCNRWNNDKPVKIARDGTEVEPRTGERLCRQFPYDSSVDLHDALLRQREHCQSSTSSANTHQQQRDTSAITRPMTPPSVPVNTVRTLNNRPALSPPGRRGAKTTAPKLPPASRRATTPVLAFRRPTAPDNNGYMRRNLDAPRGHQQQFKSPHGEVGEWRWRGRSRHEPPARGYKDLLINGSYSDYMRQYSSSSSVTHHRQNYNNNNNHHSSYSAPVNGSFSSLPVLPPPYAYSASEAYSMYMNYMSSSNAHPNHQYFPDDNNNNPSDRLYGKSSSTSARLTNDYRQPKQRRTVFPPGVSWPGQNYGGGSGNRRPMERYHGRSRSRSCSRSPPQSYNNNRPRAGGLAPSFSAPRRRSPPPLALRGGRQYRRR